MLLNIYLQLLSPHVTLLIILSQGSNLLLYISQASNALLALVNVKSDQILREQKLNKRLVSLLKMKMVLQKLIRS